GRLAPEKNIDTLISAWHLVQTRSNATLVIIGAGPMELALRQQAEGARVIWLPFERRRDVVADLLAALDVVVTPGVAETFGLAALEAMSGGTPVVASDRGGVAELIRRSGGGSIFPAYDPEALASAVLDMLGPEGLDAARRGRDYAEREHSW